MRRPSLWLLGLGALLLAAGCFWQSAASRNQAVTKQLFAMDTLMDFTAHGKNAEAAVDAAMAEVQRLDALLSAANPASEVSRLNGEGGGTVSEDTAALLRLSLETYGETGGLFDCTVYPLVKLWGFPTQNYRVPAEAELVSALALVNSSSLRFDGETLQMEPDQELDFGGVGKGYAAARVMEIFREHGVRSGMVSLGGNVQVLGQKPDKSPWRIGVRDPEGNGYFAVLSLEDKAAVTSGGYERYFEADGETYIHILDPRTGRPAESDLLSVTVVSADGARADALSTALFLMGQENAAAFWREQGGFDLVLVTVDRRIFITEGLEDSFEAEEPYAVLRA
ncbi:MAG: FAD:protein FMN transferase [Oscillibacter sp.]|nr:FAD:protein FMN transferase [Oscillibacter sp.]